MNSGDDASEKRNADKVKFEKILKEKFGNPEFGEIMNSIVDQMLDEVGKKEAEGKATPPEA
jgi:hypothetical protein